MNHNYFDQKQDAYRTGYSPNVQVTTGTYCVTMNSSQSSGKLYSDAFFSKKANPVK